MNRLKHKLGSHLLISGIPATLTICFIPLLLKESEKSLYYIGLFFFFVRMFSIIGSQSVPILLKKIENIKLCIYAELLTVIFILSASLLLLYGQLLEGIFLLSVRGFFAGLITSSRSSWLKKLELEDNQSETIFIMMKVFQQSTYFISGLALLVFNNPQFFLNILMIDAVSSIISIFILRTIKSKQRHSPPGKVRDSIKKLFFSKLSTLILFDILMTFSIGGINTFLYFLGENSLNQYGGYAASLSLYGFLYLISSRFLIKKDFLSENRIFIFLALFVILATMTLSNNIIILICFFTIYPFVMSTSHSLWFNSIKKNDADTQLPTREAMLMIFFALTEFINGTIGENFIYIRVISALLILVLLIKIPKNQLKQHQP